MPRFNLLREIKSIRNTVLPDTPVPGKSSSKFSFSKIWLGLALILSGGAALAVMSVLGIVSISYSPGQTPPIIIDFTGENSHQSMALNRDRSNVAISKDRSPPIIDSGEAAPDETDAGNGEGDSGEEEMGLISRPIAEKATVAEEKPESSDVWYIRFALCVMKISCDRILAGLKRQGVNAYIVKAVASLKTDRVIAGPWPTGAHAGEAIKKLKSRGYDSSVFTSGGRFFFSSEPLASKAVAEKECVQIRATGSECRPSSKKEARQVYKIYEGAFKNKRDAVNMRIVYKKRGIDCIVESSKGE